jgi:hypothetical protein
MNQQSFEFLRDIDLTFAENFIQAVMSHYALEKPVAIAVKCPSWEHDFLIEPEG